MTGTSNENHKALAASLATNGLARWRWLVERRETAIEALRGPRAGADYWATGAARFPRAGDLAKPEPVRDYLLARVDASTTVLDVGAGTGRLALPLASTARDVVAVEPSAAMAAILREDASAWPAGNLRIVPEPWMDARVEPADIVVCANVLAPIADIGPFLTKLDAHARRSCYIILRADSPDTPLEAAWRDIHGGDFPREPNYIDALAALKDVNIAAQLTLLATPTVWSEGFESRDDFERLVRSRLWLRDPGADPTADVRLASFVDRTAVKRGDRYYLPTGAGHVAILWWHK